MENNLSKITAERTAGASGGSGAEAEEAGTGEHAAPGEELGEGECPLPCHKAAEKAGTERCGEHGEYESLLRPTVKEEEKIKRYPLY